MLSDILNNKLPEFITAIAAVAAIIVTIYFQRKSQSRDKNADQRVWGRELQRDISTYIPLTYDISFAYKQAMKNNTPWPGEEHYGKVLEEDKLRNHIHFHLNKETPLHRELITLLDALRDSNHPDAWIDRRDRVQECARKIIQRP